MMTVTAYGRGWPIKGSMTNLQLLLITCWLLLLLLTQCPVTGAVPITNEGSEKPKFCGKALTDVLDIVCVNGFNTLLKMKRCSTWQQEDVLSETGIELTALYVDFWQLLHKLARYIDLLETKHKSHTSEQQQLLHKAAGKQQRQKLRRRRRVRRRYRRVGIVHECCYNGCNYVDIANYCMS